MVDLRKIIADAIYDFEVNVRPLHLSSYELGVLRSVITAAVERGIRK